MLEPSILPAHSPAVAAVLPLPLSTFFSSYFNREMLRLNHTETLLDPASTLWSRSDLMQTLSGMASDGKLQQGSNAISVHMPRTKTGRGADFKLPERTPSVEDAALLIERALANGTSFTLKFEYVSRQQQEVRARWLSGVATFV